MTQHDPLLDKGDGQVDIMDFMLSKYESAMAERNNKQVIAHNDKPGHPPQIEVEREMAKISTFTNFVKRYLTHHRPVELFYPDANFGIRLDNQESFVIAPPNMELRGSMQESHPVMVTGARYAHELNTPMDDRSMGIIGHPEDKTQQQGMKKYDQ